MVFKEPVRPDDMPSLIDWCPNIYHTVKELVQNPSYNMEKFPVIDIHPKPVLKKQQKTNLTNIQPYEQQLTERSSVIVFIAGGMTYGEAKYAPLLNEYFEQRGGPFVFLGGSQMINPDDFLEKVNSINSLTKYDITNQPSPPVRAAESETVRYGLLRKKSYQTVSPFGNSSGPGPVRAADKKKMKKQKKKGESILCQKRKQALITTCILTQGSLTTAVLRTGSVSTYQSLFSWEYEGKLKS